MKVYRFMSKNEFDSLAMGKKINNPNRHKSNRTNSIGFCFIPEKVEFSVYDDINEKYIDIEYEPWEAIEFLKGIVTNDYFVEFETTANSNLEKSYGVYADPTYISGYNGLIEVMEYSIASYSSETLKPIRYGFVSGKSVEWYVWN